MLAWKHSRLHAQCIVMSTSEVLTMKIKSDGRAIIE